VVTEVVTAAEARRLILGGQGLLEDPARPASIAALRELVQELGFVQVDSINTVARAQHLTLRTRLSGYRPRQLDELLERERFLFEHWTHDASAIPTSLYPHWWPRFRRAEERFMQSAWFSARLGPDYRAIRRTIRRRAARHGEVRAEDFEEHRETRATGWWNWSPHKAALELMWRSGELAIARRVNFQKVYAPADLVLPAARALPEPSNAEHLDWACRSALDRVGVATTREIATFWAAVSLADARRWAAAAAKAGRIVPVQVQGEGHERPTLAWAWPDWRERLRALPEAPEGMRLLCPFDPVLRDRARALRLFHFDYRFEAFVPERKRKYGYYVLPILAGDRIVGRIDPKLQRDHGVLSVARVFWEPGVRPSAARRRELEEAVNGLAQWLGADRVEMPRAR
jgi:uncharacterized protein YcaQ